MRRIASFFPACLLFLSVAAQNVGVGTHTPEEKLHVSGNMKADTIKLNAFRMTVGAGMGKIMTSDAEGNASWQTPATATDPTNSGAGFGPWGDCAVNAAISGYNPASHPDPSVNDYFGRSVFISGNHAMVGAHSDVVNGILNAGSVAVYRYNNTSWEFSELLTDPNAAAENHFGHSISISGNFAIVGSPDADVGSNIDQGLASIFLFDGSNWIFYQELTDPLGEAGDNFGNSVSISGDNLIVASRFDAVTASLQGSASIFHFDGSSWIYVQQLTHPAPEPEDWFGSSVSMSGEWVIIGAQFDDVGANLDQGSVLIYQFDGSTWNFHQQITDGVGMPGDNFGCSVSISGNNAIAGAYKDDNSTADQGSATMLRFDGTNWVLMNKVEDLNPGLSDQFGIHVSISGNYALIGANKDNAVGTNRGSVTIYQRVGLGWQRLLLVTDPGHRLNDDLGWSTAIDAATRRFVIGVPGYVNNSGKVLFGRIN